MSTCTCIYQAQQINELVSFYMKGISNGTLYLLDQSNLEKYYITEVVS